MAIYEFIINNVQKVTIHAHDGTVTVYYKTYDISRVGDFPVNDWSYVQEVVHAHSANKLNGHGLVSAITMEASPFILDQCAKKPIVTVYGRVQEETVRERICGQFCPATRYHFRIRKVIFGNGVIEETEMEKKFEDYGFRPSAVIEGLNRWYDAGDKHSLIRFANPDGCPEHYHLFYDHDKVIDDAIKYLRSMNIFYTPGMKWGDLKFMLNSKACLAELGFNDVRDAWPKVNPAIDQRKFRDGEIRDYILKRFDMNGIKIPITFRTGAVEDLIAYLFALLMQERKNKEEQS